MSGIFRFLWGSKQRGSPIVDQKLDTDDNAAANLVLHAAKKDDEGANKVLITAEYCGVRVDLAQDSGLSVESAMYPEVGDFNNTAQESVLVTSDGLVFSSNAIARYLVRLRKDQLLLGTTLIEYPYVEQWIEFASQLERIISKWFERTPELGSSVKLKNAIKSLNTHLSERTVLVGETTTLADIFMICSLHLGFTSILTKSITSEFPNVEKYFWSMVSEPNFSKVLGEVVQKDNKPKSTELIVEGSNDVKNGNLKRKREESLPENGGCGEDREVLKKYIEVDLNHYLCDCNTLFDKWKGSFVDDEVDINPQEAIEAFWNEFDPTHHSLWIYDIEEEEKEKADFAMDKVNEFARKKREVCNQDYSFGIVHMHPKSNNSVKITGFCVFCGRIPDVLLQDSYGLKEFDMKNEDQKEIINSKFSFNNNYEPGVLYICSDSSKSHIN